MITIALAVALAGDGGYHVTKVAWEERITAGQPAIVSVGIEMKFGMTEDGDFATEIIPIGLATAVWEQMGAPMMFVGMRPFYHFEGAGFVSLQLCAFSGCRSGVTVIVTFHGHDVEYDVRPVVITPDEEAEPPAPPSRKPGLTEEGGLDKSTSFQAGPRGPVLFLWRCAILKDR